MFQDNHSQVSIQKVRYIPAELVASRCMCFSPDSDKLLLVTDDGSVQVVQLDEVEPTLQHTFKSASGESNSRVCSWKLISKIELLQQNFFFFCGIDYI